MKNLKNKRFYLIHSLIKSLAISIIITTLIDFFSNVELIMYLIICIVISMILYMPDRKKIRQNLNNNKDKLTDYKIKIIKKYNLGLITIFLLLTIYKIWTINYFDNLTLNQNILILTEIKINDTIIKPDSLPYLFAKDKYYSVSDIDNYNIIDEKFKDMDIVHIYYRFRPFSRIYIYSFNNDNTKEKGVFTNRLDFGFHIYKELNDKIIIKSRGRKFIFEKYKSGAKQAGLNIGI